MPSKGIGLLGRLAIVLCPAVLSAQSALFVDDPHVFGTYTKPSACAEAARRIDALAWRPPDRADTTPALPLRMPLRREAVMAAQQCVAHFVTTTVSESELFGLGRAYVVAGMFPQADSAFERLLASPASRRVEVRVHVMGEIAAVYLEARPVRVAEARAMLARLDRLRGAAAVERLLGHVALTKQAIYMDDVALAELESQAAIRASKDLTGESRSTFIWKSREAARLAADVQMRRNRPQDAIAIMTQAFQDLTSVDPRLAADIPRIPPYYLRQGSPAPKVHASRWLNASTDMMRPAVGKRSLILFVDKNCRLNCENGYAVLRRLQAQYPDLDVTFVAQTGSYGRSGVLTQDQDLQEISQHFTERLHFNVPIAVWLPTYRRRTLDHGLEITSTNPNDENFPEGNTMVAYFVDRKGMLRYWGDLKQDTELLWRGVIGETP